MRPAVEGSLERNRPQPPALRHSMQQVVAAACGEIHSAPVCAGDPDSVIAGDVSPIHMCADNANPRLGRHSPARRHDDSDRRGPGQFFQVLRPYGSGDACDDGIVTSPHPRCADVPPAAYPRFQVRRDVPREIHRGQDATPTPLPEVSINHCAVQTGRERLIPANQLILSTKEFGQGQAPGQLDIDCIASWDPVLIRAGEPERPLWISR